MDNQTFLQKLGQRISKLRKERNITQIELSYRCDFDRSNLRRIESGRTNPTSLTLKKIAEGLDVTVNELFKIEEKKKS